MIENHGRFFKSRDVLVTFGALLYCMSVLEMSMIGFKDHPVWRRCIDNTNQQLPYVLPQPCLNPATSWLNSINGGYRTLRVVVCLHACSYTLKRCLFYLGSKLPSVMSSSRGNEHGSKEGKKRKDKGRRRHPRFKLPVLAEHIRPSQRQAA